MSKSENGAIVGQVIKGIVGLVVAIFSVKKGKDQYDSFKGKKNQ